MSQAQDWRKTWQQLACDLEPIAFFTRKQICSILEVSNSQLKRDTWVCRELNPKNWNYEPYSRGYTYASLKVLWVFRFLCKKIGRTQAINLLIETLENDCER